MAQQQVLAKVEAPREHRQAIALDQVATPLGEGALVDVGVVTKQALGDDVAEDGVAEELEALVRLGALLRGTR